MGSLPALGTPAPEFTLPSTAGVDVTLSKLRGKNVLLAFFPLAFTKVCTQEMCAFSDEYVLIDSAGVVQWAFAEDTPGTRRENEELLAHLEAHRRSA